MRKPYTSPRVETSDRPVAEAVLQRLIIARLNLIPGVHVWRNNTGAGQRAGGGLIRFGVPGQGDISGIGPRGVRLEVEVKSATGRVSEDQVAFGQMISLHGGLYVVARTLDDAINAISLRCSP